MHLKKESCKFQVNCKNHHLLFFGMFICFGLFLACAQNQPDSPEKVAEIPEITITSPKGEDKLELLNECSITWTSNIANGDVKIEISRDNKKTWETISDSTENDGSFEWLVTGAKSSSCFLRITHPGEPDISSTSASKFSIGYPTAPTKVAFKLYGINFGPYTKEGQNPETGTVLSEEQIRQQIAAIAPYTNWIRTYGGDGGLEHVGKYAHQIGLKVAWGAWLDDDLESNEVQIQALIDAANKNEIDIAVVGCEVLRRKDLELKQLIKYIEDVKTKIPRDIPVTTAEVYTYFLSHPELVDACDKLFVHIYPFWDGKDIESAITHINEIYPYIKAKSKGKQVIIAETGWPGCGSQKEKAVPSIDNACNYFLDFISWASDNKVSYFYFEAFDEPWKTQSEEGDVGSCWGIWNSDGSMKDCMQRVFNGDKVRDKWSANSIPGGPGKPQIQFSGTPEYGIVSGYAWHVKPDEYKIAIYIHVSGGWWNKPYWDQPLTTIKSNGSWSCHYITGGDDEKARKLRAYLVPENYKPPILKGGNIPGKLRSASAAMKEHTW